MGVSNDGDLERVPLYHNLSADVHIIEQDIIDMRDKLNAVMLLMDSFVEWVSVKEDKVYTAKGFYYINCVVLVGLLSLMGFMILYMMYS